jgi:hypothetical protein
MANMTTLQLAEVLVSAVLRHAYETNEGFAWETAKHHAPAVLEALRDTGHWFCRLQGEPLGNEPSVQLPLEFV